MNFNVSTIVGMFYNWNPFQIAEKEAEKKEDARNAFQELYLPRKEEENLEDFAPHFTETFEKIEHSDQKKVLLEIQDQEKAHLIMQDIENYFLKMQNLPSTTYKNDSLNILRIKILEHFSKQSITAKNVFLKTFTKATEELKNQKEKSSDESIYKIQVYTELLRSFNGFYESKEADLELRKKFQERHVLKGLLVNNQIIISAPQLFKLILELIEEATEFDLGALEQYTTFIKDWICFNKKTAYFLTLKETQTLLKNTLSECKRHYNDLKTQNLETLSFLTGIKKGHQFEKLQEPKEHIDKFMSAMQLHEKIHIIESKGILQHIEALDKMSIHDQKLETLEEVSRCLESGNNGFIELMKYNEALTPLKESLTKLITIIKNISAAHATQEIVEKVFRSLEIKQTELLTKSPKEYTAHNRSARVYNKESLYVDLQTLLADTDFADHKLFSELDREEKKAEYVQEKKVVDIAKALKKPKKQLQKGVVQKVAYDLIQYQRQLVLDAKLDHFIENKWHETPQAKKHLIEFQNKLSSFITDSIHQAKSPKIATKLVRLYVLIAKECLHNNDVKDLQTPMVIKTTLMSCYPSALSQEGIQEIYAQFDPVLSKAYLYNAFLETCEKEHIPYIPSLDILSKDVARIQESLPKISKEELLLYNFEPLEMLGRQDEKMTKNQRNLMSCKTFSERKYETNIIKSMSCSKI